MYCFYLLKVNHEWGSLGIAMLGSMSYVAVTMLMPLLCHFLSNIEMFHPVNCSKIGM